MPNGEFDWSKFYWDPEFQWTTALQKIAMKRFRDETLALEAFGYAEELLTADNFRRLRETPLQSTAKGLLVTAFSNEFENFARKKFGRARPPVWLVRAGDLHVRIFTYLCLERQLVPSIVDRLSVERGLARQQLEDIIRRIKASIPDCGKSQAGPVDDSMDELLQVEGDERPDREIEQQELKAALSALRFLLEQAQDPTEPQEAIEPDALARWMSIVRDAALSAEEQLCLRLHYIEGLSKAEVGRRLGTSDVAVARKINAVLARIGRLLTDSGIVV